jgi:hypothetical protein
MSLKAGTHKFKVAIQGKCLPILLSQVCLVN